MQPVPAPPDDLEAVLLDVGNTLLYLDYARLVRTLELDASPEEAARAERRARPRLSEWIREHRASTENPETFRHYVSLALEELGASSAVPFERLCAEHRRENFFSQPAPGALEAVSRLAGRFKLAVVSNAGGRVKEKLVAKGFGPHLLAVVDSGLEGVEKPDPRIFLGGCERAGVRPERALYVGDLYSVDVLGARAAGLETALLDPVGAYAERGVADTALFSDVACVARWIMPA